MLTQELAQAKATNTVKRQEAEARQSAKQGEVRAARKDLDNLPVGARPGVRPRPRSAGSS